MKWGRNVYQSMIMITQFGINMLVPIFLCSFIGIYLDNKLGTSFLMILFFFIGALAGFRNIYLFAQKIYSQKSARDKSGTDKINIDEIKIDKINIDKIEIGNINIDKIDIDEIDIDKIDIDKIDIDKKTSSIKMDKLIEPKNERGHEEDKKD